MVIETSCSEMTDCGSLSEGNADGVGSAIAKSRNGEQEHQHHRGGGQAKPS